MNPFEKIRKNDEVPQNDNYAHAHCFTCSSTNMYIKRPSLSRYLDYTFLSHRSRVKEQNSTKHLNQSKEYLYDLQNTLDLNMELLNTSLKTIPDNEQLKDIKKIFSKLQAKYNERKEKKTELENKKAKHLIARQILGETKRKIEETANYYKDQIKGNKENIEEKEEYINIFQKKLKEIEIYIHKNLKIAKPATKYAMYSSFKMHKFLNDNTSLMLKKDNIMKNIDQIRDNINNIRAENRYFFDEFTMQTQEDKEIIQSEKEKKIKSYMEKIKKKIHVIQMRMKLLRSRFQNMSNTLIISGINNIKESVVFRKESINMLGEGNEEGEKSQFHLDLSRKMNDFMDFSIVLNKKDNDESKLNDLDKTGGFGQGLGKVSNINMWDISIINKK